MNVNYKKLTPIVLILTFTLILVLRPQITSAAQEIKAQLKVFITNWPAIQNTAEQNKDSNGNIKVHEQGIANVNVVNTTPIPVIGIGTGGSSPNLPFKTVKVFDNQTINQGQTLQSSFIDVEGYRKAALFLNSNNNGLLQAETRPSIDGIDEYGNAAPSCSLGDGVHVCYSSSDIISPKIWIYLTKGINSTYPASSIVSVSLYLIP